MGIGQDAAEKDVETAADLYRSGKLPRNIGLVHRQLGETEQEQGKAFPGGRIGRRLVTGYLRWRKSTRRKRIGELWSKHANRSIAVNPLFKPPA